MVAIMATMGYNDISDYISDNCTFASLPTSMKINQFETS